MPKGGFSAKQEKTCAKSLSSPYLHRQLTLRKGVSMDKKIWSIITQTVVSVNRSIKKFGRRTQYSDVLIVRMYLWAVWHDRPLSWACCRDHYNSLFRPRSLPSISQFCRRVKTKRFEKIMEVINERLTQRDEKTKVSFFDGKPLPVGENTCDKEAKNGYAGGCFRHGYKLHAWATEDGRIPLFHVLAMNAGEPNTARELLGRIDRGCLVLADANYDSAKLYKAVDERGGFLLTPLKGRAKSKNHLKRMHKSRKRALELWKSFPEYCESLLRNRVKIERIFSALTCFGGGLSPLPSWVRKLSRVQKWVSAKIIIYHARLLLKPHNL